MRAEKGLKALALRASFLGSGGASVLAFAPYHQFWLAWFCLLPLFSTTGSAPWYRRFTDGFLYGLGFYGVGLAWFADAATNYASFGWTAANAAYAALIAYLALFPALFKWAMSYTSGRCWGAIVFAPALWLMLETVRGNAWGGFPWLSLGSTQLDGPLAALIPLVGEPGMAWIVVAINAAVYTLVRHWRSSAATPMRDPRLASLAAMVALCSAVIVSCDRQWSDAQGKPKQIGVLGTSVGNLHALDPGERNELWSRYRRRAAQLDPEPDLLVLPEAALGPLSGAVRRASGNRRDSEPAWLLGSVQPTLGGNHYNSTVLLDPPHRARYRKQRLVPFAEDRTSWLARWMLSQRSISILRGRIDGPITVGTWQLGIAICWEIRFGERVMSQVRRGARVVINQSNQSWLNSRSAEQRTLAAVRMRAAESARPIVRVANSGTSIHVDHRGDVATGSLGDRETAATVAVQPREGLTPYAGMRLNERLRWLALSVVSVGAVVGVRRWRSARRDDRQTSEGKG